MVSKTQQRTKKLISGAVNTPNILLGRILKRQKYRFVRHFVQAHKKIKNKLRDLVELKVPEKYNAPYSLLRRRDLETNQGQRK